MYSCEVIARVHHGSEAPHLNDAGQCFAYQYVDIAVQATNTNT